MQLHITNKSTCRYVRVSLVNVTNEEMCQIIVFQSYYIGGIQRGKQETISSQLPQQNVGSPPPEYEEINTESLNTTKESNIDLEENKAYGLRPAGAGSSSMVRATQRGIELHENVAYGPASH